MAYVVPATWVTGDIITASRLNQIHDNLADLDARTTVANSFVAANESTTSGTYTDLATPGPAVSLVTGATVIAMVTASISQDTSGQLSHMGVAISGATTSAAADLAALALKPPASNGSMFASAAFPLNPNQGTNTFTAKYKATGGSTATFSSRYLMIVNATKLS